METSLEWAEGEGWRNFSKWSKNTKIESRKKKKRVWIRSQAQECIICKKDFYKGKKTSEKWKGQIENTIHEIFHIFKDMCQQTKRATKFLAQWVKPDP